MNSLAGELYAPRVLQKQIITIIMPIKIIGIDYLANVSSHATVYQVMRRKKVSRTTVTFKMKKCKV